MKQFTLLTAIILWVMIPATAVSALKPVEHPLFASDSVHTINLTFHQNDWWDSLLFNYKHYDDPPYLAAEFDWGDIHYDSIGVRFKGNSSYFGVQGVKKSFKLDIDAFVGGLEIYGLDKLNLNNCYMDPSFVREKCAYELCEAVGLVAERTNYAALYLNSEYWGLYLMVEQLDQEFIESRFGTSEEGNLWKGDEHGSLEYLGTDQTSYYSEYELKTNEEENDWSALIELTEALNNTTLAELPDTLHVLTDVNSALAMLAIDLFTVNLDSYVGRCANYYLYHRDLDGRFVFAKWDLNMAWGGYNPDQFLVVQMKRLTPYWINTSPREERPLAERLWQIEEYDSLYLGHFKKLMSGKAYPDTLIARMEELRDLVRDYVYDDPNKFYTDTEFEQAMTSDINVTPKPGWTIPGLEPFIRDRDIYLRTLLGTWTLPEGLVINEVMADNETTVADEFGDYDDWIEITNTGSSAINLDGIILTDCWEGTADYTFPDTTLNPGEYIVVWADDEASEGDLHAPFKLSKDGEDIYLINGFVILDQVTFPALSSDITWGRWADGSGDWQLLSAATPGAENQNPENPEEIVLYINEFMALNSVTIQDEMSEYEDWLEIYNPGPGAVDMGGLYLTDDLTNTTQWTFPDTTLEAGGFLLVWCDDDTGDGPLHTNFKLSGDGEEIGLFGRLSAGNNVIDSYTFGVQSDDISEGRETDGNPTWIFFTTPTPGASNGASFILGDANGDGSLNIADASYIINAIFFGGTRPDPIEAADANSDGSMNIADASFIINYVFFGGPAPCNK